MSQNIFFQQPQQSNDLQFQSFSYGQPQGMGGYGQQPTAAAYSQPTMQSSYAAPPAPVSWRSIRSAFGTGDDPSEPPLLHGRALMVI